MSERRPHWTDELVYAVIHEIGVLRPSPHSLRDTAYAVNAEAAFWASREGFARGGSCAACSLSATRHETRRTTREQPDRGR